MHYGASRTTASAIVITLSLGTTFGQVRAAEDVPPPCNSFSMQQDDHLTWHQKFCYYRENKVITGSAIFGAAFFSSIAQVTHDPPEWPQGGDGFGRRFGTRYAQGLTKSTTEFLFGAINREDPRPHPPTSTDVVHKSSDGGLWTRLGWALLRTVWTSRDSGKNCVAWSRVAGALASGFVGDAWLPNGQATVAQSFKRSGSAFGGYIGASVFSEFQPELFGMIGKSFGAGKISTPRLSTRTLKGINAHQIR